MKVGLLLNSNHKLCSYSEKYKEALLINNIPFIIIDPNSYFLHNDLSKCTHLVFRHSQGDSDMQIYDAVYNIAKNVCNIMCMPDYETFWPYENKIKEYYLLKSTGFPIIDSHVFWNSVPAETYLKTASFPLVGKLSKGAGSNNVVIIGSADEGRKLIRQIFEKGVMNKSLKSRSGLFTIKKMGIRNYGREIARTLLLKAGLVEDKSDYPEWQIQKDAIIFQKFLPGNFFDTRVTIIGNRAFAFRRFVRENDFRASGSGDISMDIEKIDPRCIEIAFSVSKGLKFTTMAYDFLFDEYNKPFMNEISYCFVDSHVANCPGYWDENLSFHPVSNWPQYYQLVDFLGVQNLKPV